MSKGGPGRASAKPGQGPRERGAGEGPPLAGLTILNTRDAGAAPALTHRLEALGARVIERPMIAFAPPTSWQPFDARFATFRPGDWVAFTSATAVSFALGRIAELGGPGDALAKGRLAAVGAGTAAALQDAGLTPEVVPDKFQGEGLLEALLARLEPGARVWLPRAEQGRETLAEGLAAAGYEVAPTPAYRTVKPRGALGTAGKALAGGEVDWVLFTSPSTVAHFLEMAAEAALVLPAGGPPRVACLGEVTAAAAREKGLMVALTPERQDLEGLVAALAAAAGAAQRPVAGKAGKHE